MGTALTSPTVKTLIEEFGKLPGIGPKSAERLATYVLQSEPSKVLGLARAIEEVKAKIRPCKECFNLTEAELCDICSNPKRDRTVCCVVEQPRDLAAIEKTGSFGGVYHVLGGRIAPLEGITPDRLHIAPFVDRVRRGIIQEIIMATNPTLEGDGTALFLSNVLADYEVRITRLARGLASGTVLEFANKEMLADALAGRQKL